MSEMILISASFFLILLALYVVGVPVGYSIGLTTLLLMVLPFGIDLNLMIFAQHFYLGLNSFVLLAVPLFILAGRFMNEMGMTEDIFNLAESLVGSIRGAIGHVNIIVSMIFAGMSGSALADAAGLGTIEYEAMTERGYDNRTAVGITGASATIGPIIPPSIAFILYGSLAEESVGALFIAGIVPGVLMGLSLMATILILSYTQESGIGRTTPFHFGRFVKSLLKAIPALFAPVIIIGGIFFGVFTPTEAAGVTCAYVLLIDVVYYKNLDLSTTYDVMKDTFADTAVIMVIIGLANVYAFLLTIAGVPAFLTSSLLGVTESTLIITILLVVVLLILGTFIEPIALIMITVPILAPSYAALGIDPIAFGVIMVLALTIGLITPPLGMILFVLERVTDLELLDIFKGVLPFYIPLLTILATIIFYQELILFLPRLGGLL